MVEYRKASLADILEDARDSKAKAEYLKSLAKKTYKTENGTRKISFMEIKYQYFSKYYAELMPKKADKKSMWDLIAEL